MQTIFISGFGDIAQRVTDIYTKKGQPVKGLCRMPDKLESSSNDTHNQNHKKYPSVSFITADLDELKSLPDMDMKNSILFHFAPPPSQGQTDSRLVNLLQSIKTLPEKLILLSTTAVYGDCQGQWITEQTPVNAQNDRGKRRLHAEQTATDWGKQQDVAVVILRVGGIYGANRLPIARIKSGTPIIEEASSPFTNRIHEDDLAMICVAAAEKAQNGDIYNVSDGKPGTMTQYFKDIAKMLGLPQPPEINRKQAEKQLSAGMLSYLKESRRIDNSKMLQDLGVTLQYPNLTSALEKIKANHN